MTFSLQCTEGQIEDGAPIVFGDFKQSVDLQHVYGTPDGNVPFYVGPTDTVLCYITFTTRRGLLISVYYVNVRFRVDRKDKRTKTLTCSIKLYILSTVLLKLFIDHSP